MFFFGLPAILVAVCGWNFRILQTISIKRARNKESSYEISLKLDEKCSRGISYSSQVVFFHSLHHTCFSSAICPLQVPGGDRSTCDGHTLSTSKPRGRFSRLCTKPKCISVIRLLQFTVVRCIWAS